MLRLKFDTYRLLAVKLQILFRWHERFRRFVWISGINPFRNVSKHLLRSKHAVGIQTRAIVIVVG